MLKITAQQIGQIPDISSQVIGVLGHGFIAIVILILRLVQCMNRQNYIDYDHRKSLNYSEMYTKVSCNPIQLDISHIAVLIDDRQRYLTAIGMR
ncbi:MAG: hypothetical protein IPP22_04470 [Nitrosomonas sp.]|nr:hypothetical protein [Nitrosomonas sp.]